MGSNRTVKQVETLLERVTCSCLGNDTFELVVKEDIIFGGRLFIQAVYMSPCTKTGDNLPWKGRKFYLSEFMTDDEIIKTAYVAFEAAVKHEIMEGFKVDDKILFNPHVNFEELLAISDKEISRELA